MNEAAASAIEELVAEAHRRGAHETKVIDTCLLTPRQWVRMKCQFGCPAYGTNYTCPPHVPGLGEVERFIGEYSTALRVEFVDLETLVDQKKVLKALHAMEREALFAGLYKAFGIAAGPCHLCKVCKAAKGSHATTSGPGPRWSHWNRRVRACQCGGIRIAPGAQEERHLQELRPSHAVLAT